MKLLVGLAVCSVTLAYHIDVNSKSYTVPTPSQISRLDDVAVTYSEALAARSLDIMSSYASIGCYQDSITTRMLRTYIASPEAAQDMTVKICATACYNFGFPYAGIEFGQECFCDNLMQTLVTATETDCNIVCPGDSKEICGGNLRINIYSYSGAMPLTWTANASPTTITSDISEPTNSAITVTGAYEYLGCYSDVTYNRTLGTVGSFPKSAEAMTIKPCQDACQNAGYVFAGVEFGHECWCGNDIGGIGVTVPDVDCNMPCNGNASETCGGRNRIDIYSLTPAAPLTFTSPAASSTSSPLRPSASFVSLGCYTDSRSNRTLRNVGGFPGARESMAVEPCQGACGNAGYYFAGLEFGTECWCDNIIQGIGSPTSGSDCNMPCSGNASETCGGSDRINIYQLVLAPSTALLSAASACPTTGPSSASICVEYYQVSQGDDCYSIWTGFHISQEQFTNWNPSLIFPQCQILIGQSVCVQQGPASSSISTIMVPLPASPTGELAASIASMASGSSSPTFTVTTFTTTFETVTTNSPTLMLINSGSMPEH